MNKEASVSEISSLTVVEPLPQLLIRLSKSDRSAPSILVDGMAGPVAMEIPWGKVIDVLGGLLGDLLGGGSGGGGGGGGCTTIKITNADGSSTEIKQCPAPKAA